VGLKAAKKNGVVRKMGSGLATPYLLAIWNVTKLDYLSYIQGRVYTNLISDIGIIRNNCKITGVCGRARSIIPSGASPALARQVNYQIVNIGQAEVTPNVRI
jgi:hypothetical protein